MKRRRRRLRHEDRVAVDLVLAALPAAAVALVLLWTGDLRSKTQWTFTILIVASWAAFAIVVRERVVRTLQTIANLLAALREEDFSIRGRSPRSDDALGELMTELNALAQNLRTRELGAVETAALLAKVSEETDLAMFAFDSERRLRLVNRAGSELLGERRERLLGRGAADLGLAELLDSDAPRTVALPFRTGRDGPWELRRTPFRQHGRPHTLIVLSDVSRALREEERQAWQRLVRVLSHEINNSLAPISSIVGSLRQTLARDPSPPSWGDDAARGLEVIQRRADSLARFMTAYAKLARLPPPEKAPIDVAAWVQRVVDLEKRAEIAVVPGPRALLYGDAPQLEQLLINLLSNAVDAAHETEGGVAVTWAIADGTLELRVLDEGPGLSDTANLFVPFFTTKPAGSGIGLALSRQIADAHHGTLHLENRRDRQGCEARLVLPLNGAAATGSSDRPPSGSAVPHPETGGRTRERFQAQTPGPARARRSPEP